WGGRAVWHEDGVLLGPLELGRADLRVMPDGRAAGAGAGRASCDTRSRSYLTTEAARSPCEEGSRTETATAQAESTSDSSMTVSRSGQNAGATGHHSAAWQPRPCKPVETATSADVVVRVVTVSDSEIIP